MTPADTARLVALAAIWGAAFIFMRVAAPVLGPAWTPELRVLLGGLALLGGWAASSTAQIIDADECERACYAQESVCTEACGTHTNPVECDGQCRDELEDCLRECR